RLGRSFCFLHFPPAPAILSPIPHPGDTPMTLSRIAIPVVFALLLSAPLIAEDKKPVLLKVLLPRDDATLTIHGKRAEKSGKAREGELPPLAAGAKRTHTLVATIKPNNYTTIVRTRKVEVTGDQAAEIDMRDNDPKQPDDITIRFVPTPPEVVEA